MYTVHLVLQYGKLQFSKTERVYKFVVLAVIWLFLFKAVYGIHGQSLIISEINRFNDRDRKAKSHLK